MSGSPSQTIRFARLAVLQPIDGRDVVDVRPIPVRPLAVAGVVLPPPADEPPERVQDRAEVQVERAGVNAEVPVAVARQRQGHRLSQQFDLHRVMPPVADH